MLRQVSRQVVISLAASCWSASICLRTYMQDFDRFHPSTWSACDQLAPAGMAGYFFLLRSPACLLWEAGSALMGVHRIIPFHFLTILFNIVVCFVCFFFIWERRNKVRMEGGNTSNTQFISILSIYSYLSFSSSLLRGAVAYLRLLHVQLPEFTYRW